MHTSSMVVKTSNMGLHPLNEWTRTDERDDVRNRTEVTSFTKARQADPKAQWTDTMYNRRTLYPTDKSIA